MHLGRKTAHRKSMLANMACSLIEHKRINTTVTKAKALKQFVEPIITKAKDDTTHNRRTAFRYLRSKEAVADLFRDVAAKVGDRPGGYTRIIKLGNRLGDNADMAMIELVDFNDVYTNKDETKRNQPVEGKRKRQLELFTTLFSLMLLGEVDNFAFGIGTTAGSAIFNGMIIPAVAILAVIGYGIAHKVTVSRKVILRDGIGLIIAELILIYMVSGNHLTWVHGLVLMLTYVVYVAYMFGTMKKKEGAVEEDEKREKPEEQRIGRKPSIFKALILLDFEHVFVRKKINTTNAWTLLLFSMLVIGLA